MAKKTSGQEPFRFSLCDDLYTLPERARPHEVDLHGGFADDTADSRLPLLRDAGLRDHAHQRRSDRAGHHRAAVRPQAHQLPQHQDHRVRRQAPAGPACQQRRQGGRRRARRQRRLYPVAPRVRGVPRRGGPVQADRHRLRRRHAVRVRRLRRQLHLVGRSVNAQTTPACSAARRTIRTRTACSGPRTASIRPPTAITCRSPTARTPASSSWASTATSTPRTRSPTAPSRAESTSSSTATAGTPWSAAWTIRRKDGRRRSTSWTATPTGWRRPSGPRKTLGVELADHIHNAVWYERDGQVYLICQAWNPGHYFVLAKED